MARDISPPRRFTALVPFDGIRARAPLLDMTAGEGQDALSRGQPWRWGRARRCSKGAAQRAAVCTSMESEALPNMASILQENAFPRRQLLGIRLSKMDRHQTEPVPASGKGVLCPCLPGRPQHAAGTLATAVAAQPVRMGTPLTRRPLRALAVVRCPASTHWSPGA